MKIYSSPLTWNIASISDTFVFFGWVFPANDCPGNCVFCRLTTPNPKTLGEVVRFSSVLLPTKYLQSRIFMIFICQLENISHFWLSTHLKTEKYYNWSIF